MHDPVSETLFLPLRDGPLALPEDGPALFLRARLSDALSAQPRDRILCEQTFKPHLDAMARAGFSTRGDGDAAFGLTLVLPPRSREESRALLARAVQSTRDSGYVVVAASNLEGARTVESDLKALTGTVTSLSKNKARVAWAQMPIPHENQSLLLEWAHADAPRPIADDRFVSRPGLFAWDRIDAGSRLLIDHLPVLSGVVADMGAGFGYLAYEALSRNPGITRLDVIEAESRALDMARRNLAVFGDRATFHWLDATRALPATYDAIISNPPFHIDRADRHELGQGFIASAARALRPGGSLILVANRHLPYEVTLKAAFKSVAVLADNGAYKVLKAIR